MKDNKNVKKEKKAFMTTKERPNNTVEVEIQKSPAKTIGGRIFLVLILAGTVLLPVGVMIYTIIEMLLKK